MDEGGADDASILDPIEAFGTVWKTTARKNRALLDEVYTHIPRDSITNFSGAISLTLAPFFRLWFSSPRFLVFVPSLSGQVVAFGRKLR